MPVYWGMLFASLFIDIFRPRIIQLNGIKEARAHLWQALLVFAVIIFFTGLRTGIGDTKSYIIGFEAIPNSFDQIDFSKLNKDRGFYLLQLIFKRFISTDYHLWLLLISAISGISVMIPLYKYSTNFSLSSFIFISSCNFTYMMNGMRQFFVVSILFLCVNYIIEQKTLKYILLVLLLSTIHGSALIMIPVYFIVRQKPWSRIMNLSACIFLIIGLFFSKFENIFSEILKFTQYEGYMDLILSGNGSNIIRFFVVSVPAIIAFWKRKKIDRIASKIINISINMSVLSACTMFASTLSSGIFIGRISIYFEMYNLLLLPWLLLKTFNKEESMLLIFVCIALYIFYFYYQMVITWNLHYISDILNLYI